MCRHYKTNTSKFIFILIVTYMVTEKIEKAYIKCKQMPIFLSNIFFLTVWADTLNIIKKFHLLLIYHLQENKSKY